MDKEVVATLSTVDDYSIVEFQGHTARGIVNYPEASNHSCLKYLHEFLSRGSSSTYLYTSI